MAQSARTQPSIRAVVLLSGGMDSCVCAAQAARDFSPQSVSALHVFYGQRTHSRERKSFEAICDRLGLGARMWLRNDALREIGGSALTDDRIPVPEQGKVLELGEVAPNEVPVTYVPFRNAHFLAAAVSWAEVLGASKIYIGAVEQDSSGYPDCRPEYYRAFNEVIRAGTKEGNIEVVTPLIAMHKWEIVRLGLELGAPFDLTWSCYSQGERACGRCDSCVLRLRAFEQAGFPDPVPYAQHQVAH